MGGAGLIRNEAKPEFRQDEPDKQDFKPPQWHSPTRAIVLPNQFIFLILSILFILSKLIRLCFSVCMIPAKRADLRFQRLRLNY